MTDADYEILLADYLNRGGVVHRMPTAVCSTVVGYIPAIEDRSALSDYYAEQEAKRFKPSGLRKYNAIHSSPPRDKVQGKVLVHTRRKREATKKMETENQSSEAQMSKGMTVTVINGEETRRIEVGNAFVIYSRKINGRQTISVFDQHQSFRGTVQLRKPRTAYMEPQT